MQILEPLQLRLSVFNHLTVVAKSWKSFVLSSIHVNRSQIFWILEKNSMIYYLFWIMLYLPPWSFVIVDSYPSVCEHLALYKALCSWKRTFLEFPWRVKHVYWAKVLTDHPKNYDNVFLSFNISEWLLEYFIRTQFGIYRAHQLLSGTRHAVCACVYT